MRKEQTERGAREQAENRTEESRVPVTRRAVLRGTAAAGATTVAATGQAAALPLTNDSSELTRYVAAHQPRWFGRAEFPTGEVITHETGDPRWIVAYETPGEDDEDAESTYDEWLEDWIEGGADREEIRHDADAGRVTIAAPTGDVLPRAVPVFGDGNALATRSGVRFVEPNRELTNVDPVGESDLIGEDAWEAPGTGLEHAIHGQLPAAGNRFDDTGPYDLADVRGRTRVEDVAETGAGTRIGVVDTGLNYDAGLYGDRVVAGKNTITGEEIDPAADDYDAVAETNLHGSWVTTAAAGNGDGPTGEGVATDAEIVAVRALDDDGSGTTDDIVRGIEYCVAQDCDVINLSLGSEIRAEPVVDAVREALQDGGVSAVVAAAGNSRMTTHYMGSPAEHADTIPVASIDAEPAEESLSAYYSSVAPHPQSSEGMGLSAPGHRVNAAVSDGDAVVDERLSGTSMAAPVVAGVVAVVLEADPDVEGEPVALRERLEAAAEPLPKCGVTEVGAGRVDAVRAVQGDESESDQESARSSDAEGRDVINRNIIEPGWVL